MAFVEAWTIPAKKPGPGKKKKKKSSAKGDKP